MNYQPPRRNDGEESFVIWMIAMLLLLIAMTVLNGCSASKNISTEANNVRTDAAVIREEVSGAKTDLKAGKTPAVEKHLDVIDGRAVTIQKSADKIQNELTGVMDKVSPWIGTLKWIGIAVALVAMIFVAWRLNLLILGEKIIQGIVTFIAKVMGA